MQTIKKVEKQSKTVYEDVEKEYIITSDGRQWSIKEKSTAEAWENKLNRIAQFKKNINYTEVDIKHCNAEIVGWPYEHNASFVFYWTGKENVKDLLFIQNMYSKRYGVADPLVPGQYICIEYVDSTGDYTPSFDGYFGLLTDYLKYLDEEMKKIQDIKKLAQDYILF